MKVLLFLVFCLLICFIHIISSEGAKKETNKTPTKKAGTNTTKAKDKESPKNTKANVKPKEKSQVNGKDHVSTAKGTRSPNIKAPFDQILEKLSNCAVSSTITPSIAEVMQGNLEELQSDEKYFPLFNAAPHTAAFLKKQKQDSTKFISGLRQALNADWSSPAWKSYNEIDTLFRPLKQQFVYTMMRFNCT